MRHKLRQLRVDRNHELHRLHEGVKLAKFQIQRCEKLIEENLKELNTVQDKINIYNTTQQYDDQGCPICMVSHHHLKPRPRPMN